MSVHYGTIQAIKGISFAVTEGEIITLIGANGAGKTSALHALSGIIKKSGPASGIINDTAVKEAYMEG